MEVLRVTDLPVTEVPVEAPKIILAALVFAATTLADPLTVDFQFVPAGSPAIVEAGDTALIVFSVFNSTSEPLFLYQAGLAVTCGELPCVAPPPPIFNETLTTVFGPGTSPGLAPGSAFIGVLYSQIFPTETPPGNPYEVTPSVNFTGYTSFGNIFGPTFTLIVVRASVSCPGWRHAAGRWASFPSQMEVELTPRIIAFRKAFGESFPANVTSHAVAESLPWQLQAQPEPSDLSDTRPPLAWTPCAACTRPQEQPDRRSPRTPTHRPAEAALRSR